MMYQGHSNDGSSVQNHSVGDLYPFVVYAQQQVWGMGWGVQGMGYDSGACFCYESGAIERAQEMLRKRAAVIERMRAQHRVNANPMIRMAFELCGGNWAPTKGIPVVHTRRIVADYKARRQYWAADYIKDNADLPMAAVAEGLRMRGYSRGEVSISLTAYVMGPL